jgi:hypothetical protein
MNSPERTILCVLDKLKYEWDFAVPKDFYIKERDAISHKVAKECTLRLSIFEKWYADCNIRDFNQLKNILTILKLKGLFEKFEIRYATPTKKISSKLSYNVVADDQIIWIIFIEDFENKYRNIRKELLKKDSDAKVTSVGYSKETNGLLRFHADTNDISYKDEFGNVIKGGKGFAFLSIFNQNKNTPLNIEDIKKFCNPLVSNPAHLFEAEKDIDDTLRLIKSKLKVQNKAFFPIEKRGSKNNKKWIWIEK